MNSDLYDYFLPEELIGKNPPEVRHNSRLLVYNTKTDEVVFDYFFNLIKYLPKESILVFNDTKVVPARVFLNKKTRGKVETFFLVNEWDKNMDCVPVLFDRKMLVGDELLIEGKSIGKIVDQKEKMFFISFNGNEDELFNFLDKNGNTPIPKYIKGSSFDEKELRERYQTVFAKNPASVAAPTASLHFTDKVFDDLNLGNIRKVFVTLSVGLGTFAPVSDENFKREKLHLENFNIEELVVKEINDSKKCDRQIGAVGTTVVRVLETFGKTKKLSGGTEIFIKPPFNFLMVDFMITNFHLPNSSLMMLVEAFLNHKKTPRHLKELYEIAIKEKMKFYSFGDAMLII